jgi:NADPH2:quinone reductase
VTNVKVGDRVYIFGALSGSYAQYSLCNSSHVFHLPSHISFEKGACLGTPAFTAYRALFEKSKGKSGETVFIHGASGGVGFAAIQLAKSAGLSVVGTAGTQEGLDAIISAGASRAYNHNHPDYVTQIQTDFPKGFDICLEMLASSNLRTDFSLMCGRGGRIAIIGNRGEITINPRDIMSKELSVYGVALLQSTGEELSRASQMIGECLERGQLDPVISMRYTLEESPLAHQEIIERKKLNIGNIVLIPK